MPMASPAASPCNASASTRRHRCQVPSRRCPPTPAPDGASCTPALNSASGSSTEMAPSSSRIVSGRTLRAVRRHVLRVLAVGVHLLGQGSERPLALHDPVRLRTRGRPHRLPRDSQPQRRTAADQGATRIPLSGGCVASPRRRLLAVELGRPRHEGRRALPTSPAQPRRQARSRTPRCVPRACCGAGPGHRRLRRRWPARHR